MKSKKLQKIISILIIAVYIMSIATFVFAGQEDFSPKSMDGKADNINSTEIKNVGNGIIKILQTTGIVLSVIMLIVIGIKYLMGSAEEKAEYKKTMIPYIVGAGLIFAAAAFAQVIYNFFMGVSSTT